MRAGNVSATGLHGIGIEQGGASIAVQHSGLTQLGRRLKKVNRALILGIFVLTLVPVGVSAQQSRCLGGNPAITHVEVQSTHTVGKMNQYVIVGTVVNHGTANQPSSTLQFVDIFDGAQKVDSKTIPPLTTSGTFHFTYNWNRATDAGAGSTTFTFKLRMVHGTNCNPAHGGIATLKF
jgi:hypothetical protein